MNIFRTMMIGAAALGLAAATTPAQAFPDGPVEFVIYAALLLSPVGQGERVGGYMVQGVVKLVKRVLLSLNVVLDGGDVERDGG